MEKKSNGNETDVTRGLVRLLADTTVLAQKARGYHWNVTGPHFSQYHALFEAEYTALAAAQDELAERVRQLGPFAPGGLAQLLELTSIREETGAPGAADMLRQLGEGHEAAKKTALTLHAAAEEAGDEVTVDLMVERLAAHDKSIWFLRAST